MSYLTSTTRRVAQISTLLLSCWALKLGSMSHIRVFLTLESKIGHAHWTIGRADAASNAVVIRWAESVPLSVPFIHHSKFSIHLRNTWCTRNSLLLIAELSIFMHSLPWITTAANETPDSTGCTTSSTSATHAWNGWH